jgi:hypothetical protein
VGDPEVFLHRESRGQQVERPTISTMWDRRPAKCDEPCLSRIIELAALRRTWLVHGGSLGASQDCALASPVDGGQTDIQGSGNLGVDPAGAALTSIRLQEDASTGHGADEGSAAACRLLQEQTLGFITRDTMEHGEALQAVGCEPYPMTQRAGT